MRILGIDFGDKTIGLALSDRLLITAQVLGNYRTKNSKEDLKYFRRLVEEYDITEIVIGLPLRMNRSSGPRAEKTKKFAALLEKELKLPVILWDERLTTKQAYQILNTQKIDGRGKKKLKDQVAATLILSSYLEKKHLDSHGS